LNFNKYIGLPYKHGGRDFDGVGCAGLCILIYKDMLNITFPDFVDISYSERWYKEGENHLLSNITKVVTKVDPPYKRFDGIILYNGTKLVANHIGLWIGDGKFIHIYENIKSRVDRFEGYWKSRLYSGVRLCQK